MPYKPGNLSSIPKIYIKMEGEDRPLIPALGRQWQADLCEFNASLVYRESARTDSKATEKPLSWEKKTQNKKQRWKERTNSVKISFIDTHTLWHLHPNT